MPGRMMVEYDPSAALRVDQVMQRVQMDGQIDVYSTTILDRGLAALTTYIVNVAGCIQYTKYIPDPRTNEHHAGVIRKARSHEEISATRSPS
jgi:hypothetical protein